MQTGRELTAIDDGANWTGLQLAADNRWKHVLTEVEINGLLQMAARVRSLLGNNPDKLLTLPRQAFDPGPFAARLETIAADLRNGTGIALVSGLPVEELGPIDTAIIYWGVGLYLGDAMPNNPEGDMLGHVTDKGKTQLDPNSRGYQTREALDYHCDQSDIVGLICIRTARAGGVSKISSSVAMYNTLLKKYPDYSRVLSEPLYWTKHGEHGIDEKPFYTSPVFNFLDARLCTAFGPKHIVKGHKLPGTPALTALQSAALQRAEQIADEQRFEMTLEVGDMQFLNNYVVLHTRSEYEDFPEPEKKRLLWRLWLMREGFRGRTDYSKQWQKGVQIGETNPRIRL